MSGIAVAYRRDGSPATNDELVRMTGRIAHRGPDGIHHWVDGPIGLAHCAMHTLPEDVGRVQPIHSADLQLHLTFDGRIDNRNELLAIFNMRPDVSDSQLVLAAYEKWGEFCPERLLGDFAFALWDGRLRKLFCARDVMGICPFCYFLSGNLFLAASEKGAIFTSPVVTTAPNEPIIAALLCGQQISQTETIHRDIIRLAPACCMTMTSENCEIRRYWTFDEAVPIRHRTSEDYAEHLWSIIREATRCRSRSISPVGVLLSGGLDSTAIAAAAAELRDEGLTELSQVAGFSQSFRSWTECDEEHFVTAVSEFHRLPVHYFPAYLRDAGEYERGLEVTSELPDYPNDAFWDELRSTAYRMNYRVLLTGTGGDDWLTGSYLQLADAFARGQVLRVLREAPAAAAQRGLTLGMFLWRYVFRPKLPSPVIGLVRACRGPRVALPECLPDDFIRRTDIRHRFLTSVTPVEKRRVAAHDIFQAVYERGEHAFPLEAHSRLNARSGLEFRHPMHDRRFINFGHGIPDEERLRGGIKKFVLRNALRGRAPEQIRMRRDKANFSRTVALEVRRHGRGILDGHLEIEKRGWVEPGKIQEMWVSLVADGSGGEYSAPPRLWTLWMAFSLEVLIRKGRL